MPSDPFKRAVKFFQDTDGGPGTVKQKLEFLQGKGLTEQEILAALEEASGSEAVRAAVQAMAEADLVH